MQSSKIQASKKTVAEVYLCTDYPPVQNRDDFIFSLSKNIKNSPIGYAGFSKKEYMEQTLTGFVFDFNNAASPVPQLHFDQKKILKIVKQSVIACHKTIPTQITRIFVFPNFSNFVRNKMSGVLGYTPYKNTILVFVNPLNSKWKNALADTIIHEFNHSVFLNFHKNEKFLDVFIFEGLAEHFREYVVKKNKQTPWTKVLPLSQVKKILLELKKYWTAKNYYSIYQAVFFGNKKYPRWTGYTIGYYIVKSFLKNNKNLDWKKIIKLSPQEILDQSKFL